ncbi:MAG: hypothetical protein MI742_03740 [Desulfobacterales bacterium]|nr:hypothetical protein [Desulfobacterales bacterium]
MKKRPLFNYCKKHGISDIIVQSPECLFGQIFARDRRGHILKGNWKKNGSVGA